MIISVQESIFVGIDRIQLQLTWKYRITNTSGSDSTSPLALSQGINKAAGIPEKATSFTFIYPLHILAERNEEIITNAPNPVEARTATFNICLGKLREFEY